MAPCLKLQLLDILTFFRIHTSLIRRASGRIIRNLYQSDRSVSLPKPHVSLISSIHPLHLLLCCFSYPPLSIDSTYCTSLRQIPLRICKLSWILSLLHLKYKRFTCWQFSSQYAICHTRIRTVNRISIWGCYTEATETSLLYWTSQHFFHPVTFLSKTYFPNFFHSFIHTLHVNVVNDKRR